MELLPQDFFKVTLLQLLQDPETGDRVQLGTGHVETWQVKKQKLLPGGLESWLTVASDGFSDSVPVSLSSCALHSCCGIKPCFLGLLTIVITNVVSSVQRAVNQGIS